MDSNQAPAATETETVETTETGFDISTFLKEVFEIEPDSSHSVASTLKGIQMPPLPPQPWRVSEESFHLAVAAIGSAVGTAIFSIFCKDRVAIATSAAITGIFATGALITIGVDAWEHSQEMKDYKARKEAYDARKAGK